SSVTTLLAGISYRFVKKGEFLEVSENQKKIGTFRYVKLIGGENAELKVTLTAPSRRVRAYQNNISLSVNDAGIRMINEIYLDNYVAGVTDAEAGTKCTKEFYKVQAILARTFALAHI